MIVLLPLSYADKSFLEFPKSEDSRIDLKQWVSALILEHN